MTYHAPQNTNDILVCEMCNYPEALIPQLFKRFNEVDENEASLPRFVDQHLLHPLHQGPRDGD